MHANDIARNLIVVTPILKRKLNYTLSIYKSYYKGFKGQFLK